MNNTFNEELIEQYLNGELHGGELDKFESQLNSDASLQNEVKFQKNVIDELSNFRRAQMKARLAAIPVAGGGLTMLHKSLIIGASTIAAAIGGFFVYNNIDSDKDLINQEIVPVVTEAIEEVQTSEEVIVENSTSIPYPEKEIVDEPIETAANDVTPEPTNNLVEPAISNVETRVNPFDMAATGSEDISIGNAGEGDTDTKFANDVAISKATHINVTPQDGSNKLKYKYDGKELVLIGKKFKEHKETFTLLMDGKTNHLYLSFEGEYFEIINHHNKEVYKLEPLESLEDINKLKKAE